MGVIVLSAAVALSALWVVRAHSEFDSARVAAQAQSNALATAAHRRQQEELENQRTILQYISEAQADREIRAAGSPLDDKTIHHCRYGSSDTYRLDPCQAPWFEAPQAQVYSREDNVAEQTRMRLRAEAQLRVEEQRYAALTGQQGGSWLPGSAPAALISPRQRCDTAKAQRDEAYRIVGNDRSFDFIRQWDDLVFQACKDA